MTTCALKTYKSAPDFSQGFSLQNIFPLSLDIHANPGTISVPTPRKDSQMTATHEVTLLLKINRPVDNEVEAADIAGDMVDHLQEYLKRRCLELIVDEAREVD
jgi:hypothetical protein